MVYLDAKTDTYLEEVSSCNIFIVSGKTVKTPALTVSPMPLPLHTAVSPATSQRNQTSSPHIQLFCFSRGASSSTTSLLPCTNKSPNSSQEPQIYAPQS